MRMRRPGWLPSTSRASSRICRALRPAQCWLAGFAAAEPHTTRAIGLGSLRQDGGRGIMVKIDVVRGRGHAVIIAGRNAGIG